MNPPRVPESDPLLAAPRAKRKSDSFRSRLGIYLIGVALGLMIVGLIYQKRQAEMKMRNLQRDSAPAATAPAPPAAPAAPAIAEPRTP